MTRINDALINESKDDDAQEKAFAIEKAKLLAEIDRLNAELSQSKQAEKNSARFKPRFLPDMSHELKTPMNAIVGLTDLLRRSPLNPEQMKLVGIIQSSGRVLLDVINDVLTFSELEEGRFDLQAQVFGLTNVVESAAQSLSDKARERDIYLTTLIAPELSALMIGDADRLRQIFVNLIAAMINANQNGKLHVRLTAIDRDNARAGISSKIIFFANSTGPETAIAATRNPTTESASESALILEVARRIIEHMGGTLTFDYDAVSFELHLPEAPTSREYEKSKPPFLNSRILLGNLQESDRELLLIYARAFGTTCDIADTPRQIVEFLNAGEQKGEPYDLLVTDMQQQLQDSGIQSIDRETLTAMTRQGIQLVVIKPYDDVTAVDKLFELQIARPLTRPINQTRFLSCLTESINFREDSPVIENETAFENTLLTASQFDLSQRVLVVEDNQVNREVVKLQLKTLGLKPLLVSGGMQALEEVAKRHYDFIFMDCQMPKMDGYSTTRNIRRLESTSETGKHSTIIALTANALPGDKEKCLEAGMDDFISKPVTVEKLGHILLAWQTKNKCQGSDVNKERLIEEHQEEGPPAVIDQNDQMDLAAIKKQLVTTYGESSGQSIFDLFCSSTPDLLKKMEAACEINNWTALIKATHELKGQCSVVQASKLATMCRELEQVAKSEKREGIESVLNKLRTSYENAVGLDQHRDTSVQN